MAPLVPFTAVATPVLPWPACEPAGKLMLSPASSFHAVGAAAARYFVKLLVVPEASARCTIVMSVSGNEAPGLSVMIAASFHFLMLPWKMFAIVSALSCSLSTPLRLYDTVIGAATVG